MLKNLIRSVCLVLIVAGVHTSAQTIDSNVYIRSVGIDQANPRAFFFIEGDVVLNPNNCTYSGVPYYEIDSTDPWDDMLAVVMSAHAMQYRVSVWVSDTKCGSSGKPVAEIIVVSGDN